MARGLDRNIKRGNANIFQLGGSRPVRNPMTGEIYAATEPLPRLTIRNVGGDVLFGPVDMAEVPADQVQADGNEIGPGRYRLTVSAEDIDALEPTRVYAYFTIGTETTIVVPLPVVRRIG